MIFKRMSTNSLEIENRVAVLVDCDNTSPEILEYALRCLLYTSDAADERSSVDLGGRRIIKKKKKKEN